MLGEAIACGMEERLGQTGAAMLLFALLIMAGAGILLTAGERKNGENGIPAILTAALFILFTAGAFRMHGAAAASPSEAWLLSADGTGTGEMLGVVQQYRKRDEGCVLLVRPERLAISGREFAEAWDIRVVSEYGREITAGSRVEVRGRCRLFSRASNPGEFDSYLYYRGQKIRMGMSDAEVKVLGAAPVPPARRYPALARGYAGRILHEIALPEDEGIFRAVLLGDREGLGEKEYNLFRDAGISHILTVSGTHVSLVCMTFAHVLRRLGLGFGATAFLSTLLILFYGTLTGGTPVFRAGCMAVCALTAGKAGRTYDLLSAAALSLLFAAADAPFLIFSGGMQLSFLAVFALGLMSDRALELRRYEMLSGGRFIKNEEKGARERLVTSLQAGLMIQGCSLPSILYHYFVFPWLSPLLNLAVIPLLPVMVGSGLAGIAAGAASDALSGSLAAGLLRRAAVASLGPGHMAITVCRVLCRWSTSVPETRIFAGRPDAVRIAGYIALMAAWWYLGSPGRPAGIRTGSGLRHVLPAAALLLILIRPVRGLDAWFLDVGQGDGMVMATREAVILSDCGSSSDSMLGERRLGQFLRSQGIRRLDCVLASHGDADHISGIRWLLGEDDSTWVRCLVMPEAGRDDEGLRELAGLAEERGTAVEYLSAGDEIRAGKLILRCLHPGSEAAGEHDRNRDSLVFSVSYGDFRMLLTGDIGAEEEEEMMEGGMPRIGDTDVLKVAHHGSGKSSGERFLREISPAAAVISCAKNNRYGHPAKETLERLSEAGAEIFCTMNCGAVHVRTDGRTWTIRGYRR